LEVIALMDQQNLKALKDKADKARILYKQNKITRAEANAAVMPYILMFNKRSEKIAKKYNQRPKYMNFASYVR
jgi:hypothetical protein